MAGKEKAPENSNESEAGAAAAAPSGSRLKLILIIVGAVLVSVLAAGGGVWFYLSHKAPAEHGKAAEAEVKPPAKAIYHELKPPFVVTLGEEGGNLRYMQVAVTLMTREPEVQEALTLHEPLIRNNLNMLLAGASVAEAETAEGRTALQQKALAEVNRILEKEIHKPKACESVLFTSFVIQ